MDHHIQIWHRVLPSTLDHSNIIQILSIFLSIGRKATLHDHTDVRIDHFEERFPVNCMSDRLTKLNVVKGRLSQVESHQIEQRLGTSSQRQIRVFLDLGIIAGLNRVDDMHRPSLGRDQFRRRIHDDAHFDPVQVGKVVTILTRLPVILKFNERNMVTARPRFKFERTSSDRVSAEIGAMLFHCSWRSNHSGFICKCRNNDR